MIPSSVKAVAGLLKRVVRLGGTPPGSMKGLRELRNPKGTTGLQAPVDCPRVTTGFSDQRRNADVAELHGIVRCS